MTFHFIPLPCKVDRRRDGQTDLAITDVKPTLRNNKRDYLGSSGV